MVRNAYSGYNGKRPKLAIYHGTADNVLYYQNFIESTKQWPNVFGISWTRNQTNTPIPGYTKLIYGDGTQFVAYSAAGVDHNIPSRETDCLDWFGTLSQNPTGVVTTKTSTQTTKVTTQTTTSKGTTSTSGSGSGTAAHWAQCGGIGWTGPTSCASPYTCMVSNPYYSQCL